MVNQSKTQNSDDGGDNLVLRSIQVDINVWELAKQKAKKNNQSLSSIVRQLLKAWVEDRIRFTISSGDDNKTE
jgi:hypothetical protein